jgi:hypothetical protein
MKKRLLTILVLVFWAVPALPEMVADTSWVRRYDAPGSFDDEATAITMDDSGNVYVTGTKGTIKYDRHGNQIWFGLWGGVDIAVDNAGYSYVTGGRTFFVTVKYNPDGDTAWVRIYERSEWHDNGAMALTLDSLFNVYVTGSQFSEGTYWGYVTVKYYSNGDTAWVRIYDLPVASVEQACDIAVDHQSNVYVTGYRYDLFPTEPRDCVTIKYDSSGNQLWLKKYDGPGNGNDYAYFIVVDESDNLYIAGETFGRGSWGDFLTIKYRPNGDTAWVRTYNGPYNGYERVLGMALDSSGHIYVTGYSGSTSEDEDYATIKYDSSGNELWVRRYNGPGNMNDIAFSIATDRSENVYITGCSYSNVPNLDYTTIKYDSVGNELWVRKYNGPGNGIDEAHALAVDDFNNIYVTGWSYGSGTDLDYATLKYSEALRGDTDRDGVIDLDDVVYLINYLYMHGYAPEPVEAGNTNCDGVVDVGDIIYLINYVLKGGPEPSCS